MRKRLLALATLIACPLFAQQKGEWIRIAPVKSGRINLRAWNPGLKLRTQGKPVAPNEHVTIPHNLPIPPGAIRKPFTRKLPFADERARHAPSPAAQFPVTTSDGLTIPPDLGGAVGPNHVVAAHNSGVFIQTRTGTTVRTSSLEDFFPPAVTASTAFDPRVLYDRTADRWVVIAPTDPESRISSLIVAVSMTGDPTGDWMGYDFTTDTRGLEWFDFPSIGINRNWIVITGNIYSVVTNAFVGSEVLVFDKRELYAGGAMPRPFIQTLSGDGGTIVPATTLDDTDTEYLVNDWNGEMGSLRLYTITGTPSAPVLTPTMLYPTSTETWAAQNDFLGRGGTASDFAPQSGTTHKIQNNDSRVLSAVVRNGSLWCAQTAFLPTAAPTHAAAQWWQIDPMTAAVQQFGRVEDPSAAEFFAFPTLAVNAYGDALLGDSSFAATQFASAAFSMRLHDDPPNSMRMPMSARPGLASYFVSADMRNRWGDYTSTVIDPDDFSMWTLQEYASTRVGTTDRWGTEWTHVIPPIANLFMQDVDSDNGAEPDPSTQPMWESNDIWLRASQDPTHTFAHMTENGVFRGAGGMPNFVYVEVRNRGGDSNDGTQHLTVYWAKASAGLSWPSPWTGGVFFDAAHTMLAGDVIGTRTIPVIDAGSNTILEFPWSPPDPAVYMPLFGTDERHFCLLARITSSDTPPFGMTFLETDDLNENVRKNNRIAWKNVEVMEASGSGAGAPARIVISNMGDNPMQARVRFELVDAKGQRIKAEIHAKPIDIKPTLAPPILARPTAVPETFALAPKQSGSIEVLVTPPPPPGSRLRATQTEVTKTGERVVGGVTIEYR